MSQADIDKAIKDAEKFAEEDKKQKENVEIKNKADSLVFQAEKTLAEVGDKVSDADKAPVNTALEELKTAISGGNVDDIKAKTESLEKAFYALSEKLYAATGAAGAADGAQGDPNSADGDGTYYNADYEDKTGDN